MVENQLRTNRINDPAVLKAMTDVPRELFLPKAFHGVAYADEDLLLADGRFMIEPLVFARMLQAAAIEKDDIVLVVGCDTGYAAAVTSKLAATVISVQRNEEDEARIQPLLDQVEADNVAASLRVRPIDGDPDQAPFDVILVLGALDAVPPALVDQLNDDGRLVAVEGRGRIGRGVVISRMHGAPAKRELFDAHVPDFKDVGTSPAFAF